MKIILSYITATIILLFLLALPIAGVVAYIPVSYTHLDVYKRQTLDFVGEINKRDDIDFVIHGGDMSDFGVTDEFLWQRDIMNKLRVPYTEINLPYIMPVGGVPKHLVKTLTRAQFESLAPELIQACLEPCQKAMSAAGLNNAAIDEVILVGRCV